MKFYRCSHCGNIIAYAEHKGVKVFCCGEAMNEITPNTVDASQEKHLPVVTRNGNIVTVTIGTVPHPMTEEHNISWVALETKMGNQRKVLSVNGEPKVDFALCDGDEVISAYAYCNLHSLWKQDNV